MTDDHNQSRDIITIDSEPQPAQAQLPANVSVGALPMPAERLKQQREDMRAYLADIMKPGIHYDYIGEDPFWKKEGAELLFNTFQLAPKFQVANQGQDGEVGFLVTCLAIHLPTTKIVGEGIGSCTSLEEKYAWRRASCDAEFDYFPEHQRRISFKAKWQNGQQVGHYENKQVRQDPMSQSNTILKMAKIRAQRDCAGNVLAVSDILKSFKQASPPQNKPYQRQKPQHTHRPQYNDNAQQGAPTGELTQGMLNTINRELQKLGIEAVPALLREFGVNSVNALPASTINDVLDWIKRQRGDDNG